MPNARCHDEVGSAALRKQEEAASYADLTLLYLMPFQLSINGQKLLVILDKAHRVGVVAQRRAVGTLEHKEPTKLLVDVVCAI